MKKGQLSSKMVDRFPIIETFVKKKKRLPNNFEIRKIFNIAKGGVGETTKNVLDAYKNSLTHCVMCKQKLK